MAAPRAVKKQVEEAEALMKQLETGEETSSDEQEEQQAQSENEHDEHDEQEVQGNEQPEPRQSQQGDFEHKYNVLRGKYDKEVPQLHAQLRDMQSRQAQLESLIAQMNRPSESQQSQPDAPASNNSFSKLTAEEVEEYGEDLIDVIRRAAVEAVGSQIARLEQQLNTVNQQVGGVTQVVSETKRDKVFAKLDSQVENWRDLNRSPEFLEWLKETDPYSGNQRGVMLRKAFDSGEADRVIAFFKGFLNEHAAVSSSQPEGSRTQGKPKVDANKLVTPGKSRANKASAGAQEDKRYYTEQEINEFYKAVSRGDFRKKPEEKDKTERAIFRALNEGRVVPANQVPVSNAAY